MIRRCVDSRSWPAHGERSAWSPALLTAQTVGALAFLVGCGTVLGFAAYTWLMREQSAATVGAYAFVNPMVALALAWGVGDEHPSARSAIALLLVLGAVVLTRDRDAPSQS